MKVVLNFRGREMAHTEFGFQVITKFIADIEPYGHPDFQPTLVGRSITLMISPLPRNKRAKNPHLNDDGSERVPADEASPTPSATKPPKTPKLAATTTPPAENFASNPSNRIDLNPPAGAP